MRINKSKRLYIFSLFVILLIIFAYFVSFFHYKKCTDMITENYNQNKVILATLSANTENTEMLNNNLSSLSITLDTLTEKYNKLIEINKDIAEMIVETENTDKSVEDINSIVEEIESIGKWSIGEELPLPNFPTNVKLCTDYRFYNILGTPHNRLQSVCWTDEYGCRRYNEDYCVGLGSFYSTDIGDRFQITLDTGKSFTIILGDGKADCDTDDTNRFTPCYNYEGEYSANILEFIIDDRIVSSEMRSYGSLDYYEYFKGDIVSMVYLGRDNAYDFDTYE